MPDIIPPGTIKQFVIANGWTYHDDCGCQSNMEIYVNLQYPDWQILISKDEKIMQIKQKMGGKDGIIRTSTNAIYYKHAYSSWIKPL